MRYLRYLRVLGYCFLVAALGVNFACFPEQDQQKKGKYSDGAIPTGNDYDTPPPVTTDGGSGGTGGMNITDDERLWREDVQNNRFSVLVLPDVVRVFTTFVDEAPKVHGFPRAINEVQGKELRLLVADVDVGAPVGTPEFRLVKGWKYGDVVAVIASFSPAGDHWNRAVTAQLHPWEAANIAVGELSTTQWKAPGGQVVTYPSLKPFKWGYLDRTDVRLRPAGASWRQTPDGGIGFLPPMQGGAAPPNVMADLLPVPLVSGPKVVLQ